MSDSQQLASHLPHLLPRYSEAHWYAVHTCSRREKQVNKILQERGIENFLPLYESKARPRHGGPPAALPLFPGYEFVHIALRDRLQVLQVPGVANLVCFQGQPAPVDDQEIEAIRVALQNGIKARPHPYCKVGQIVEIRSGPLQGVRGRVLRKQNRCRIVLSLNILMRSVVAEIDENELSLAVNTDRESLAA